MGAERRSNALQGEMEEARALLDSAERGKRQTEAELTEARMAVNEMNNVNSRAAADKRRAEGSVHTLQAEIDDMLHQAKGSEEKAKKAMVDAARLADELRAEQDHVAVQTKNKRSLETTMAGKLQAKIKTYKKQIEEAEEIAALNLAKFRKAQQELEETEDRVRLAESALHH